MVQINQHVGLLNVAIEPQVVACTIPMFCFIHPPVMLPILKPNAFVPVAIL